MGYAERVWTAVIHETMPVMKRRAAVAVAKEADAEIAALRAENERLRSELTEAHTLVARVEHRCRSQNDELQVKGLHRIGVPTFDRHTLADMRAWLKHRVERAAGLAEPKGEG